MNAFVPYKIYPKYSDSNACANIVDLDQTPKIATSDQVLHFLPFIQQFLDTSTGIFYQVYQVLGLWLGQKVSEYLVEIR